MSKPEIIRCPSCFINPVVAPEPTTSAATIVHVCHSCFSGMLRS
jgi:hypothetical protein